MHAWGSRHARRQERLHAGVGKGVVDPSSLSKHICECGSFSTHTSGVGHSALSLAPPAHTLAAAPPLPPVCTRFTPAHATPPPPPPRPIPPTLPHLPLPHTHTLARVHTLRPHQLLVVVDETRGDKRLHVADALQVGRAADGVERARGLVLAKGRADLEQPVAHAAVKVAGLRRRCGGWRAA
eukprot:365374-Chlamydomonas_euryale.AAC.1